MYFEIFGLPYHITPQNVLLAGFITFIIFLINQFRNSLKKFQPYKDPLANQSVFFIYMIRKDYFNLFYAYIFDEREEFAKKLWQVANVFDINRLQEKKYRNRLEGILHQHHAPLRESYFLFLNLRNMQVVHKSDIIAVVNKTHETLDRIIIDINKEFENDTERPAA